jgi:hypothetical protein
MGHPMIRVCKFLDVCPRHADRFQDLELIPVARRLGGQLPLFAFIHLDDVVGKSGFGGGDRLLGMGSLLFFEPFEIGSEELYLTDDLVCRSLARIDNKEKKLETQSETNKGDNGNSTLMGMPVTWNPCGNKTRLPSIRW